ncbi:MAG: hypothetical protein DRG83_04830 [Deltaproteobacteria bacterium]|nr:MAG: hypothetical protein DRG83_04830 [Deltaproteobacteria bacterium]
MKNAQIFRTKSLIILLAILAFLSNALAYTQTSTNPIIGVKTGQWAKYVGSEPYEEYEWMHVSFTSINETKVKLYITFNVRRTSYQSTSSQEKYHKSQIIDVKNGENNFFLFLIPSNLSIGDFIPVPLSYPRLVINGIESKEYAGVNRTVMWTHSLNMPWGGEGIIYWDRNTGLLVEILARIGNCLFSSLRLIETNVWTTSWYENLTKSFASLSPLILSVIVVFSSISLIFAKKTKIINKTKKIRQKAKFLTILAKLLMPIYKFLQRYMGRILVAFGFFLGAVSIMTLSQFDQLVFSLNSILAIVLIIIGVLIHTDAWAQAWTEKGVKIDIGAILIALAIILFAIAGICAIYRTIGATVPYKTYTGIGPSKQTSEENIIIEVVYLYPYASIASTLATIALCFAIYGFFVKIFHLS